MIRDATAADYASWAKAMDFSSFVRMSGHRIRGPRNRKGKSHAECSTEIRPRYSSGPQSRLHPIRADIGYAALRRDLGGRLSLLQSGWVARRSARLPAANGAARQDFQSRGSRHQGPDHGGLRDHTRADHLHEAERRIGIGQIYRRMGAAERRLARRFGARHALLA